MPRSKRTPIDYKPQFGGGIFRSKEDVDQELAVLDRDAVAATDEDQGSELDDVAAPQSRAEEIDDTLPRQPRMIRERTNERTNVRWSGRTNDRTRTRHSFDIWQDQLLALTEIQLEQFNRTGRKPKLGELVQEALDAYIAQQRKRTNVRTNER